MMGGSYVGIVQWKAALANNPHLKAIFPVVSGYDDYRDRYLLHGRRHETGQPPGVDVGEHARAGLPPGFRPVRAASAVRTADIAALGWTSPMYREVIEHPAFDRFWRAISTREQLDKMRVPVFSVGGWYDNFVRERSGSLRRAAQTNRREPHPDRSVAAQHVDSRSRTWISARIRSCRCARFRWSGSTSG